MTMANLISKRVAEGTRSLSAQLNRRLSRRVGAGVEASNALEKWEAEGGASAGVPQASEHDADRLTTRRQMARSLHGHKKPGPV